MNYRDILHKQLPIDEDVRESAYQDSLGYWTIGVGHLIDARLGGKIGRDVIYLLLENDIIEAEKTARAYLDNFDELSDERKAVVVNMAFNLGYAKLGTFTNTLQAIRDGRWDAAANGMLSSKWAEQVGPRAVRLADKMRRG